MIKKMSLERRKSVFGVLFILPWLVGLLFLFLIPLIQSLRFSFHSLILSAQGFDTKFESFENYRAALFSHPSYVRILTESIVNMTVNLPLVLLFSIFAAVLLNQKFIGRTLARSVFFLPVILMSGVLITMESDNFMAGIMQASSGEMGNNMRFLRSFELNQMLLEAGVSHVFVDYLTGSVNRIYEIVSSSGVQILIFLAGLQTIPKAMYEVSKIEGATGYEAFWKITLPMITPLILINTIYTIIDSFTSNKITKLLTDTAFKNFNFGLSAAMAWIYFLVISVILTIVFYAVSKRVFYHE